MFFLNDTATTEIYTLSLHDALPISRKRSKSPLFRMPSAKREIPAWENSTMNSSARGLRRERSEEHTSELQSRQYLVCRLLLEQKKILDNKSVLSIFLRTSLPPLPRS